MRYDISIDVNGAVQTLTTTCERPAALRPEEAQALLK